MRLQVGVGTAEILDPELSFKHHIAQIVRKVNFSVGTLYRSRNCFSLPVRKKLATQLILPIFDYADIVYQCAPKTTLHPLDVVYNKLCRFILGCPFTTHHCTMFEQLNWFSLTSRRRQHWLQFIFKCIHFNYPPYLKQLMVRFSSTYQLRHSKQFFYSVPGFSKCTAKKAFMWKAPSDWNNLPANIRSMSSLYQFKNALSENSKNICTCK